MSKDLSAGLFASRSSCISCCVMYNAVVSARLSKHPCRASVPVRASDAVFQGTCNAKVLNATFAPCQGASNSIPSAFALAVGVQLPRPASYAPPMSAFSINGMVLQEAAANGRLKVVAKRAGTPLSSPFDGLVQPESPKAQLLKSSNSLRASFGVEWRRASVTSRRPAR
ncbi:hypothetical protein CI102_1081 [Trichoderma harzianum]|nr:hypothetical protein CI102_1081 [Trichoderma harzianum]